MKIFARALAVSAAALSLLWVVAFARELGSREARERIAEAVGLDNAKSVHIKSISAGMGGQAIVEARIETAFRFQQDKEGNWQAVEVRTGDRRWESIELVQTAINKEKVLRTTADLRTLATALEAFRRERGFYVAADNNSALVDNLAPRYLSPIIRIDAWAQEFEYKGTEAGYRLQSLGPDGRPNTGDEIVIENGQLIKGAS
ncbi:MAG TPA: type II secretion system protein GspG [Blastocatellia bacterium]|nr:type II secretion system protein GspG [Blastocatellia bacterium]